MEVSGQLHAPAALHPGRGTPVSSGCGDWVGPRDGLDWMLWSRDNVLASTGNRTRTVQPVARRYTDWKTKFVWLLR
jgi:hypothetical protein